MSSLKKNTNVPVDSSSPSVRHASSLEPIVRHGRGLRLPLRRLPHFQHNPPVLLHEVHHHVHHAEQLPIHRKSFWYKHSREAFKVHLHVWLSRETVMAIAWIIVIVIIDRKCLQNPFFELFLHTMGLAMVRAITIIHTITRVMVCLHYPIPRPIKRPIKNRLYTIVWMCSYCLETYCTDSDWVYRYLSVSVSLSGSVNVPLRRRNTRNEHKIL